DPSPVQRILRKDEKDTRSVVDHRDLPRLGLCITYICYICYSPMKKRSQPGSRGSTQQRGRAMTAGTFVTVFVVGLIAAWLAASSSSNRRRSSGPPRPPKPRGAPELRSSKPGDPLAPEQEDAMSLDVWTAPVVAITLTQIAVVATSIYLHRALAHRALVVHPVADVVFRTVLWLTTGQRRQEWVAVHRKHHAFTDREGDPHSPRLLGFWKVQLWNV